MKASLIPAVVLLVSSLPASCAADAPLAPLDSQRAGVVLTNRSLTVRIVDNAIRLNPVGDDPLPGYSGIAALIASDQGRNIFGPGGMNYEVGCTLPAMGRRAGLWNAPRLAPMGLTQLDASTVRLTQRGAEAAGLNIEITYHLDGNHVDQAITTWPDADIRSSHTFWASYMLFVQNTSLYLRAAREGAPETRWLEMTSAGHNGSGDGTYFRPCDPTGKAWQDYQVDNPVLRQAVFETAASRAATESAGFRLGHITSFDNFFFGFVDDHVALWIFRPTALGSFTPRLSASGAQALRRPAWDFGIESGPQKAGERRTFELRFVYKRYAGLADLLAEVDRFQSAAARDR